MPHFTVHISEAVLDRQAEEGLIRGLTDAVGSVYGERFTHLVAVDLIGIPRGRRGLGGKPTAQVSPNITLSLREAAYRHPTFRTHRRGSSSQSPNRSSAYSANRSASR